MRSSHQQVRSDTKSAAFGSRFGRRRTSGFERVVVLALLAVWLTGCQQFIVLSYLLGGPPSIEPDFDTQTGESMSKPNVKVAVVGYAPPELQWNFPQIHQEVAAALAYSMGQHKIKVAHPDYVRAWVDEHRDWEDPAEIGRAFKCQYVVVVEINAFTLYEEGSTTLYRGKTEVFATVTKVDAEGHGDKIYTKSLEFAFPTKVPRSAYEQPLQSFKREFLSRLSEKLGWLFFESYQGDQIPWVS